MEAGRGARRRGTQSGESRFGRKAVMEGMMDILDEAVSGAYRRIVLVGAVDTGKTFLARQLADRMASGGRKAAFLDFDLGQSTVGPPGCVGLQCPWREGSDPLFPTAMIFIGLLSPAPDPGTVVEAGVRLHAEALALGYEVMLVDTTGMVEGGAAALLKRRKIRALEPDLVLALGRERTEHIFRGLEGEAYGRLEFLEPSPGARRRSREERIAYRRERLNRYFREAARRVLDMDATPLVSASSRVPADPALLAEGCLLGLNDHRGLTLALARLEGREGSTLRVSTPWKGGVEEVACLVVAGPGLTLCSPGKRRAMPGEDGLRREAEGGTGRSTSRE